MNHTSVVQMQGPHHSLCRKAAYSFVACTPSHHYCLHGTMFSASTACTSAWGGGGGGGQGGLSASASLTGTAETDSEAHQLSEKGGSIPVPAARLL